MRMMMKVSIPVEAGNKSIADGSLSRTMMKFVETHRPEAAYFIAEGGCRVAVFFVDLANARDLPVLAETFFMELHASIEVTPAMSVEDMQAGVTKAMKKR